MCLQGHHKGKQGHKVRTARIAQKQVMSHPTNSKRDHVDYVK